MQVTLKRHTKSVDLPEKVAKHLIKKGLAYETRQLEPADPPDAEEVEISPRTGLPKRQYRRRDMKPEE